MRDRLFALLGIENGEESMVSMLLTQSVFLGIFFGAFDISAHSLFLSIFDEKMMAKGYVVSGIAGIILTSLYTWLQTRLKFRNFAIINLIAVTSMTLVLWAALIFTPSKWVVFIVFIMLGPLNILAMLGFWGTTGRLFTLRQGKRLFGLVDSGLIVGIIISCYAIPVLLSFSFESHNILLLSAFSVLIATIIQIVIGARFRPGNEKTEKVNVQAKETKSIISVFRQDSYTRVMAIFVALSVVTAFFVQYSFMAVTRAQYPAEEDMARFLGIFTGSMMIFTLLVKLLVFSYIIRNYGLKTCLAISPILIAGFTALAIGIGSAMGYTPESLSGFLIFFLLLALSRLFSKSLKDSIESPSFKVIYQTIDEKIRYEIQSGMDGTVNEIAALSSGLLLAGLGVLSFITLIHFSIVLFIIIIVWIFISFMLYSEYRKSIRKALEAVGPSTGSERGSAHKEFQKQGYTAAVAFRNDYFKLVSGDNSPLLQNTSDTYFMTIIEHAGAMHDLNFLPILKHISSNQNISKELRRQADDVIAELGKRSETVEKTDSARKMLSGSRIPHTTEILRLWRDNSTESKKIGILMIGKFRLAEMLPEVCECVNNPALQTEAESVLESFGKQAVNDLIRFYMASSGNINTSKVILRVLGKANTCESSAFLFSRLWSNSRDLKELAISCLIEVDFKPSDEDRDKLHQLISETISHITWNLSARVCLHKNNDLFLTEKINREISRWKTFLFNLLSITYEQSSINKIRENIDSETVEGCNFALEMIDIVIDDTIKPKLIALLDVVPDDDKLRNLYHFFPGEVPSYLKLQEDMINRDYNLLSLWTKACTLRNLADIKDHNMAESAAALLFSPECILQEEAARLIARSGIEHYKSVALRIPAVIRERLDRIVSGESDQKELLYEKNLFLSKQFKQIPEEELLQLSGSMLFTGKSNGGVPEDCIIWPLSDNGEKVIIQFNKEKRNNIPVYNDTGNSYLLPLENVEEFRNQFPERSFEILSYIDKNEE